MKYEKVWESSWVPLINAEWNLVSNATALKEHLGVGYRNSAMVVRNGFVETYYSVPDMQRETKYGFRLFTNEKKANDLLKITTENAKKGLLFGHRYYEMDAKKLSDEELITAFETCYDWSVTLFAFYKTTQPQCFDMVRDEFFKYLKGKTDDCDESFLVLTSPTTPSAFRQEERDWIGCLRGKSVEKHWVKYQFMGADEETQPKTLQYYKKRYTRDKKRIAKLESEYNRFKNELLQIRKKQKELIASANINKKWQRIAKTVQHYTHSRLEVRIAWVSMEWATYNILQEIGRRRNMTAKDLQHCTREEIIAVCKGRPLPKDVPERRKLFVAYLQDAKFHFTIGKEAEKMAKTLHTPRTDTTLKGHIANKGVVRGKVTVLRAHTSIAKELKKMKQGNILVATQTKPIFMPAIRKAAGIVTDEGGITSHAAIVAREFNIPCVIATRAATEVFKDGDTIEVDANKGIVRKV